MNEALALTYCPSSVTVRAPVQFVAITLLLSREHDSCFVGPGKKRGTSAESADAGTLPVACGFLNVFGNSGNLGSIWVFSIPCFLAALTSIPLLRNFHRHKNGREPQTFLKGLPKCAPGENAYHNQYFLLGNS